MISSQPVPQSEGEIADGVALGHEMHALVARLFPICRSITGDGVRETLKILSEYVPWQIHEVPSGTRVFDWTVPQEWNVRSAYIDDEQGNRVIDFDRHNLHLVGYSTSVDVWLTREELDKHLYSLPEQPDAIPYVTSYYHPRWGFCLAHNDRLRLKEGRYHAVINSELKNGSLTYAEWILPGRVQQEVFLSSYVCHPSLANNELSGPVVTTFLARWLAGAPRKYTYRIVLVPETIGSLTYLSRNLEMLRKKVIAGFNVSCVGDDRAYGYVASPYGDTLADRVIHCVLSGSRPGFQTYSFLDRGSDERQYCSPQAGLPMVCVVRSKFGEYPEYHTSLDDLSLVTPAGLSGGYEVLRECVELLERNTKFRMGCVGEPQLGKRGLYPTLSTKESGATVRTMMDLLAYADGRNDLIDVSQRIGVPVQQLYPILEELVRADLLCIE